MKIGDEIYVHGYIDEIRKDTVIVRNDGGYFGTVASEIIKQKTGKWIQHFIKFPEGQIPYGLECSVCGECIDINRYSKDGGYCFCPNCGAQMDGGERE